MRQARADFEMIVAERKARGAAEVSIANAIALQATNSIRAPRGLIGKSDVD